MHFFNAPSLLRSAVARQSESAQRPACAMFGILRRRGRRYGLLAVYEEARLGVQRCA